MRFIPKINYVSALLLTVAMGVLFWLRPNLTPHMLGADTPERALMLAGAMFIVFWVYLLVQGYPISHGDIGSASSHNLDNIVSGFPGIAAIIGVFISLVGFWPLSQLNLMIAVMALAVVWYDLWINGGAASKINRLTDEIKSER